MWLRGTSSDWDRDVHAFEIPKEGSYIAAVCTRQPKSICRPFGTLPLELFPNRPHTSTCPVPFRGSRHHVDYASWNSAHNGMQSRQVRELGLGQDLAAHDRSCARALSPSLASPAVFGRLTTIAGCLLSCRTWCQLSQWPSTQSPILMTSASPACMQHDCPATDAWQLLVHDVCGDPKVIVLVLPKSHQPHAAQSAAAR